MEMNEIATELENSHVHDVYSRTAHLFQDNNLDFKAWPKVKSFLEQLETGSIVADIGCGTGRYLSLNHNCYMLGSDRCENLASIASANHQEVMVCDNLALPYRDESFDALISIGVIHHMTTGLRRLRAIQELTRVLRRGGRMVVCVWALEQSHRKFTSQDILVPWELEQNTQKPPMLSDLNINEINGERSRSIDLNDDQMNNLNRYKSLNRISHISRYNTTDVGTGKQLTNPTHIHLKKRIRSRSMSEKNDNVTIRERLSSLFNKTKDSTETRCDNPKDIAYQNLIKNIICNQNIENFKVREFPASSTEFRDDTNTQDLAVNEDLTPSTAGRLVRASDHRYYHVFRRGELVALVNEIKHLKLVKDYYDHANWCVVVERV